MLVQYKQLLRSGGVAPTVAATSASTPQYDVESGETP